MRCEEKSNFTLNEYCSMNSLSVLFRIVERLSAESFCTRKFRLYGFLWLLNRTITSDSFYKFHAMHVLMKTFSLSSSDNVRPSSLYYRVCKEKSVWMKTLDSRKFRPEMEWMKWNIRVIGGVCLHDTQTSIWCHSSEERTHRKVPMCVASLCKKFHTNHPKFICQLKPKWLQ